MRFAKLTLSAAMALVLGTDATMAQNDCAAGKTLKDGVLTIATGNPAYFPWVIDNDPTSGKGFEAAVAYEVAKRMGFPADKVEWTSTTFDQAIQPGPKEFDFNLQQYSITPERDQTIDFSEPYYNAAQAVLVRKPTVDAGAKPELASLKALKWGLAAGTTAPALIATLVGPESEAMLYEDTADVSEALKAGQIDATLMDLPSALYTAAVVLDDGVVLGQFPAGDTPADSFGLVFEEGNALRDCANAALAEMTADGALAAIEAEWLAEATGAPVIQ
ncbi:MAG: amino acid ABC transporter substrate-binding protein [Rhodobacteraceae bacterium]|jgi:polar amino acid transport system substrate-binding protein|uniref:ABC transporter substrate-binding protein n=1 Tax=Albidovulum sp. TaxID=1872424 RepID=UPI001D3E4456|nr:ABC transporter substrate-binding protein [uncultured Defluviimonas sp.]MCB2125508.1 amino acid ABC transporter substrate-binding protein [Paracoccaceae bacterium]MCC0071250.1 amino acid ABC transporter substrate-binding protein [Paracoccaceae bacterium]